MTHFTFTLDWLNSVYDKLAEMKTPVKAGYRLHTQPNAYCNNKFLNDYENTDIDTLVYKGCMLLKMRTVTTLKRNLFSFKVYLENDWFHQFIHFHLQEESNDAMRSMYASQTHVKEAYLALGYILASTPVSLLPLVNFEASRIDIVCRLQNT